MSSFGVIVRSGRPYTLPTTPGATGRLHLTQVSLDDGPGENTVTVCCTVGNKVPIIIARLVPRHAESLQLDLRYNLSEEATFSVLGPRKVHLAGYFDGLDVSADSESFGEDIAQTESEKSVDDDTYGGSFINDIDLGDSSSYPNSSFGAKECPIDDGNKQKLNGKKRSRQRLRKVGQIVSSTDSSGESGGNETKIKAVVSSSDDDIEFSENSLLKRKLPANGSVEVAHQKSMSAVQDLTRNSEQVNDSVEKLVVPDTEGLLVSSPAKQSAKRTENVKEDHEWRSGEVDASSADGVVKGDLMMEMEGENLVMQLGESYPSFDLERAVCNHGMFMMAPNLWISETSTLQRPLRLADATTSVTVSISQQVRLNSHRIIIRTHGPHPHLSSADYRVMTNQVHRMLRIFEKDERMMNEFHKLHPPSKQDGFGRIFRSPSLFEDAVKIMLLCHCDWPRTLKMTRALCWLQLKIANGEMEMLYRQQPNEDNQERWDIDGLIGDFPSAKEIISLRKGVLKEWCNVGYRDKWIFNLARKVVKGKGNILGEIERMGMAGEKNRLILMKGRITGKRGIKGIGDFGYNVLLMCVGVYSLVPVDSETIEHMKTAHGKTNYDEKTMKDDVEVVYGKYAPFQSLVYWWEKIRSYESRLGKLSQLAPENYYQVTGSF